jgi:malate synthase
VPVGTIRVTVLIETILAAFEMDEILFELRDHIVGLNCGRWDYIFSFIKRFRADPDFVLPNRGEVTMTNHFLQSYSLLLIKTCHRRGAHAMGGMAAQIPIRSDEDANRAALAKVHEDKLREAKNGHDGTWVAHPGLVPIAKQVFDEHMPAANQLDVMRDDVDITAADLLAIPKGSITEAGLRQNINVGTLYTESWLRGIGCVPLYNLMEDAATAEISRTQVWQWVHHRTKLDDGRLIDKAMFESVLDEEVGKMREAAGEEAFAAGRFEDAAQLFRDLIEADDLEEFLTMPAYDRILSYGD